MVTADQCPRISPEFLEEERRTLPARWFAQEYMCRFEDVDDSVFAYEEIMGAIDDNVTPLFAGRAT
jgi:hypothetical protein